MTGTPDHILWAPTRTPAKADNSKPCYAGYPPGVVPVRKINMEEARKLYPTAEEIAAEFLEERRSPK